MDAWGCYNCPYSLQISMALLNARMSAMSFKRWSIPVVLPLISLMLSKFSLILPLVWTIELSLWKLFLFPCVIDVVLCFRATYRPSGSSYCRLRHRSSVLLVIWNLVCTINPFFWYGGTKIMFYEIEMDARLVCQLLLDKNGIGVIKFIIKTLNHMVFNNFHRIWAVCFGNTKGWILKFFFPFSRWRCWYVRGRDQKGWRSKSTIGPKTSLDGFVHT